eukprot:365171-Chlamydomonas_euryale.AAC.9
MQKGNEDSERMTDMAQVRTTLYSQPRYAISAGNSAMHVSLGNSDRNVVTNLIASACTSASKLQAGHIWHKHAP